MSKHNKTLKQDASVKTDAPVPNTKPKNGDIFVLIFNSQSNEQKDQKESWTKFPKSKDLAGTSAKIASLLPSGDVKFVDFGGVAEHFLGGRGSDPYKPDPPKIGKDFSQAFVYSYMPPKRYLADCEDLSNEETSACMTAAVRKAGFAGLIVTTEKHGPLGKASVLHALVNLSGKTFTSVSYFEDTAEILDELTGAENGTNVSESAHTQVRVQKYWVLPDEEEFRKNPPSSATTLTVPEFTKMILG